MGLFAIQLAHRIGAHVITTAAFKHFDFVRQLGAEQVVDYRIEPFQKIVQNVDVVFDTVGGVTLRDSWDVLKPRGRVITIAAQSEGTKDERIEKAFFIVEPNRVQLIEIGKLVESGELKTFVAAEVPLTRRLPPTLESSGKRWVAERWFSRSRGVVLFIDQSSSSSSFSSSSEGNIARRTRRQGGI